MGSPPPFPLPQHLSTSVTPLTNHCLYYQECKEYTELYQRFPVDISPSVSNQFASIVPPSEFVSNQIIAPNGPDIIPLQDVVNFGLDSPDELDVEKIHPSGYVAPGWKWNSFRTPTPLKKTFIDCRLCTSKLPEQTCNKVDRLFEFTDINVPHPGSNFDASPQVSVDTIVENSNQFFEGGLIPLDDSTIPVRLCSAEYSGVRNFLKKDVYDSRGTVLILPSEINSENFLTSEIGKMFTHVQNRRQLHGLANKGFNCLVTCARLGLYAIREYPALNFNPRLFSLPYGIHGYNPEGIKVQIILQILYYQGSKPLTLFQRCRWMIGSDIVELDSGGNHPT